MWDLKIWDCYASVMHGPDQEKRSAIYSPLIKTYTEDKTKRNLQVGVYVGGDKLGDNWVSLDPYDQRPVIDVREKLEETTLPSESFDLVVCNAILEHVEDPFACSRALYRLCKPGGKVWVEVPFVQPYHPTKNWEISQGIFGKSEGLKEDEDHGGDYWRFTPMGVIQLMKPFKMIEVLLIDEGGICFYGEKT
jgi:hypothetical protein